MHSSAIPVFFSKDLLSSGDGNELSDKDPAVVRTVETPPADIQAHKGDEVECSAVQRTEATSGPSSDKAHVHESEVALTLIGDERRENGGTRKLKVMEKVRSPSSKT